MQKRGLSLNPPATGYGLDSTGTYNCDVWSLHKDVDDQVRANSDSPLAPDRDATIFLTQKALIRRENQWVSQFFETGLWTNGRPGDGRHHARRVLGLRNYPTAAPSPIFATPRPRCGCRAAASRRTSSW